MGIITLIINSLVLFFTSNTYILDKTYGIKIPLILTILLITMICLFPSVLNKKLYSNRLSIVRDGYRLLIMFLANILMDLHLYLMIIIKYNIDTKALLINGAFLLLILNLIFWAGIIRVYMFSKQLGIRYRLIGIILSLTPIAHLIMLIIIIKVCMDEVKFENSKIELNKNREKKQICKTKYPILLVHGIFFRDFEKVNYRGMELSDNIVRRIEKEK